MKPSGLEVLTNVDVFCHKHSPEVISVFIHLLISPFLKNNPYILYISVQGAAN